ncbi:hypothetical protein [Serratia rhizosphaerae]
MRIFSEFFGWGLFVAILIFVVFYFLQGYILHLMIKKDPVYSVAHIVKYFPRSPNDLGKLDIVMTYTFSANNINYTKNNQTLNIDTTDLDEYYVGKEIPIVYYRANPKYSKIDYYHASLKR